ncbi:radical SAM protein [Helicobacter sp. MIT 21-1697]|uniref:radical SAM/SPASM domain-containing protein n=1 Tax=Helicobacter sp. MIT 21-1697 TaxID=2993733 RepID=UPI00224B4EA3|nr:radical SAM/SPASM domain-containing protein [Helicobacter sp. MIT 21-1697]MCX2717101.1 radical SAM protein [Helicobacter sp. MIT 21-1697]
MKAVKKVIKSAYKHAPLSFQNKLFNLVTGNNNRLQKLIDSMMLLCTPISNREIQKHILKCHLYKVEFEIASFCNRTCYFCPNSHIDRKSTSVELDEAVFLKILDNLAEIEYDKELSFHRFNEPLANKELILKRVKQARQKLPKAKLDIFTNGDYVSKEYLQELKDAGVNWVLMSYYPMQKDFDRTQIIKAMQKMQQKLGLESKLVRDTEQEYRICFIMEGMEIYYRSWNPNAMGSSRGGSVDSMKKSQLITESGCFHSAMSFYVDYNGLVMPCCNTRSDEKKHKPFILGDCKKQDMFEIFFSPVCVNLRRDLFVSTASSCNENIRTICADCDQDYRWKAAFLSSLQ